MGGMAVWEKGQGTGVGGVLVSRYWFVRGGGGIAGKRATLEEAPTGISLSTC